MIISTLNEYYEILAKKQLIAQEGFREVKICAIVYISYDGELIDIIPHKQNVQKGKKMFEESKPLLIPFLDNPSSIKSRLYETRGKYIFGAKLSDKKEKQPQILITDEPSFQAFRQANLEALDEVCGKVSNALKAFINKWSPQKAMEHEKVQEFKDELTGYFLFAVGSPLNYISEDKELLSLWADVVNDEADAQNGRCSITGQLQAIAKTHDKIQGVVNANASGASFVSFNKPSDTSYNKEQGLNSPISIKVMRQYTKALNYLLHRNNKQCLTVGGTTIVFWANCQDATYADVVNRLFGTNDADNSLGQELESEIHKAIQLCKDGIRPNLETLKIQENEKVYILGLSPNSARISVRFFYHSDFYTFFNNIIQHYNDMDIEKQANQKFDHAPIWSIVNETISPKSDDKDSNPLLHGALLEAIITGRQYPQNLLCTLVRRVRIDSDDDKNHFIKINNVRIGMIKACLVRKNRINQIKEDITVSLNENERNQAYLLGRLFAVLEKTQQDSTGGQLNATIKDKYFSSACATPGSVFPTILKLAQAHLAKIERSVYLEKLIGQIIGDMECSFPAQLSLDEQGRFIIGYYHQNKALYTKKNNEEE